MALAPVAIAWNGSNLSRPTFMANTDSAGNHGHVDTSLFPASTTTESLYFVMQPYKEQRLLSRGQQQHDRSISKQSRRHVPQVSRVKHVRYPLGMVQNKYAELSQRFTALEVSHQSFHYAGYSLGQSRLADVVGSRHRGSTRRSGRTMRYSKRTTRSCFPKCSA